MGQVAFSLLCLPVLSVWSLLSSHVLHTAGSSVGRHPVKAFATFTAHARAPSRILNNMNSVLY